MRDYMVRDMLERTKGAAKTRFNEGTQRFYEMMHGRIKGEGVPRDPIDFGSGTSGFNFNRGQLGFRIEANWDTFRVHVIIERQQTAPGVGYDWYKTAEFVEDINDFPTDELVANIFLATEFGNA